LRKSGHSVRLLDASALGLTYEKTIEEIKKFQPDIIGLTAVTPSIDRTVKLAYMIKRIYPFVPIVIGGPHFTAVPDKTLKDYPVFDYGVIGEGEHTIVDLVETLASGRTPSTIPGVAIRENGKIFFSSPRAPVKDMDSLPFPAWDLLDGFLFHIIIIPPCLNIKNFLLLTLYLQEAAPINVYFVILQFLVEGSDFTVLNIFWNWLIIW